MVLGRPTPTNHTPRDAALLELCKNGWANESRTDGITTTWRISITEAELPEVVGALEHLVPGDEQARMVGHFIVTHDSDDCWDVIHVSSEHAAKRIFG